ncbi:endonuclease III [Tengunoibacter tsumagoiensis]|uniref:Endonuclease III n=1 Tax=Tengunoibacter tsumagoiensis TaxID=2014871 RepID=A0A401ZZR3_9CHLR|nr:endonuclease III [Tengunoibacter tsumagoiensis]GCE12333.1 endonuclease III [Tengunoibacter tsumagoiensis]
MTPELISPQPDTPSHIQLITQELERLYPDARYDLDFTTPLELLVATQLAAQCTDERVNTVTRVLFQKYRSAQDYAQVSQEELEQDIQKITFFRNKARSIRAACQYILDHYQGEVPQTLREMVRLPGVGRKTANVILGNAFGISEGFIIDTHVGRLVRHFGWTTQEDADRAEQELMRIVPQSDWLPLAHRIIYHGRAICNARKPKCAQCTLQQLCPSSTVKP